MTRIKIADKGRGMGTITSRQKLAAYKAVTRQDLQSSWGMTSGVLCEMVYLGNVMDTGERV